MNKFLTMTAFLTLLTLPAFAEITTGATCDTTNLGQSENNSTANVEATWTPNTYVVYYSCGDARPTLRDLDMACEMVEGASSQKCQNADAGANNATYDSQYSFYSPDCAYEGHTFANWSCSDSSNNTTTYTSGQTVAQWNITSDLECTAQWTANRINIDWFSDGSRVAQNTCTYGGTITLPETPSKTGYTFGGWKLHDDCQDLSTEETCGENMRCMWDGENSVCALRASDCRTINNAENCGQYPNCEWNNEESACQTKTASGVIDLLG